MNAHTCIHAHIHRTCAHTLSRDYLYANTMPRENGLNKHGNIAMLVARSVGRVTYTSNYTRICLKSPTYTRGQLVAKFCTISYSILEIQLEMFMLGPLSANNMNTDLLARELNDKARAYAVAVSRH